MWCPHCQADIATEIAADGQSLLCTSCGAEIRKVFAPSLHPETRSARELLERWAAEEILDEPEAGRTQLPDQSSLPVRRSSEGDRTGREQQSSRPERGESGAGKPRPKFRIDAAHPTESMIARGDAVAPPNEPPGQPRHAGDLPPGHRQDAAHAQMKGPHFDARAVIQNPEQSGRSESLWGQLLAYAGVGVLTVGTVLVLWGHFGSVASYASTGWLVATGGQMLLFLGVVTLVSGGMQQTTHEVTRRVEHIGERIYRIEESTREILQGPHFGQTSGERARAGVAMHDSAEEDA
ncbi:MAG: hypothetical protein KDA75_13460 [Planctomycetaceae bacterium]|nr:hypothetical protein [Planctomycetaceae bacterium]